MRWTAALLCTIGALACGGPAPAGPLLHVEHAAAPDALDRLLARLPPGADRCAGARVGAVSSERRELVRRLSASSHLATLSWGSDTPIAAFAEVRQEHPTSGRQATFALLRVSSVERTRAFLDDHPELRIRWYERGPVCPGAECWQYRAERVDDHTVLVRRGPWTERGRGTEMRCIDLARRYPEALEIASRSAADGLFSSGVASGGLGLDVASVLLPHGAGLRRVEQYRLPDAEMADEILLLLQNLRDDPGGVGAIAEQTKVANGDMLEVRTDVRWEDLELLAGDEERRREALALEASASRPLAVDEVVVEDLEMVREQVALRSDRLGNLPPDERQVAVAELRDLLERAANAHPGQDALVERLIELLLSDLDEPADAARWAEGVLARGPHDVRAWQVRRRSALARVGADVLAEALAADGVVGSTRRARAAAGVLSQLPRGTNYELAEGAWLSAEALDGVRARLRSARGTLPLESLGETMLTLADAGGSSRSVHVRAESAAADDTAVRLRAGVVEWAEGARLVRAGAASTDAPDGGYRMLRNAVAGATGRLRVTLALTPIGGDLESPESVLVVEGEAHDGVLELRRASAVEEGREHTSVRWERVGALVGEPLRGYEVRLFPPPNVHAELADASEAEGFLERVTDDESLNCIRMVRQEASVRCNASPHRDSTRRSWRGAMAPLVFR
ncbi:MAG: hypothetical protein JJ863_22765 [Deltaproteobacteria bacterium]|nr:hypothetical protein [Deltaproteobacteria bacterium]